MHINSYDQLQLLLKQKEEANRKVLILIQGLPGSGKSTLASKLSEDMYWNHYEADMYFMVNGKYTYNPKKVGEAHHWCLFAAKNTLNADDGCIVSNTFTSDKELTPYYELAEEMNATVILIKMENNFGSIHNVPSDAITRMKNKMRNQLTIKPNYTINTKFNF